MATAWRVGLVLLAVYLLTYGGGPHAVDEIAQLGATANLVKRGSLDVDDLFWTIAAAGNPSDAQVAVGPSGDVWSKKGTAVSLVVTPWYGLALLVPRLDLAFTALLAMAPVTAATGGLLTLLGHRLGLSPRRAATAGLLYGLGTIAWAYSRLTFGEPLIAFCAVLAALVGRGGVAGAAAAGVLVALTGGAKPSALALALPIAAFVALERPAPSDRTHLGGFALRPGPTVAFAFALGAGLAALGWHNWARFGSPTATGYAVGAGEDFSTPVLEGLGGLLLSPYRGVVWFAPVVVLGAVMLPRLPAPARWLAAGTAAVTLATYAAWWTWWGGYAWGPRFLLPALPLLSLAAAAAPRFLLANFAVVSVLAQLPGALLDFNTFERALRERWPLFPRVGELWRADSSPVLDGFRRLANEGVGSLDVAWARGGRVDVPLLALLLVAGGASALACWRGRRMWDAAAMAAVLVSLVALLVRGPTPPGPAMADLLVAAADRDAGYRPGDGGIVLASPEVPVLWARDRWHGVVYGLNADDLPGRPDAERLLELASARHERLWLLASNVPRESAANGTERWLDRRLFFVEERSFGAARLRLFLTPSGGSPLATGPVGARFGPGLVTRAVRLLDDDVSPGRPARVEVLLEGEGVDVRGLVTFVHLYAGGRLAGQSDRPVSTALSEGSDPMHLEGLVYIRHAVSLREATFDITSAEMGIYEAASGQRLDVRMPDGTLLPEGRLPLGQLRVRRDGGS